MLLKAQEDISTAMTTTTAHGIRKYLLWSVAQMLKEVFVDVNEWAGVIAQALAASVVAHIPLDKFANAECNGEDIGGS